MEVIDKLEKSKKYFINYRAPGHKGNDAFVNAQKYALQKAEEFGFITKGYQLSDLSEEFVNENYEILKKSRGAGYWLWKPHIILDMLSKMEWGDYLIYMDSGAFLEKNPDDLLRCINHKGVLTFSLGVHKQSTWCKKDCFETVFGENEDYHDELQIMASFLFIRKCNFSLVFFEKWLNLCKKIHLLTDEDSISKNYPDFKEHRHDQSLLSLLVYKEDIMYLPDITQWCYEHGFDVESRKIVQHHRNNF